MAFLGKFFLPLILVAALIAGLFLPELSQWLAGWRHLFLIVIMFFVGLEQRLTAFLQESRKLHWVFLSLLFNYFFFSACAWGVGWLFFRDTAVFPGFAVLGAVPVTLTSAVIFTRLDRGNDRLALLIVFFSQVLSIMLSPQLIAWFLKSFVQEGTVIIVSVDVTQMMGQLLYYFLLPLLAGMLVRRSMPLERLIPYLTKPEQLVIAFFVFVGAGRIPSGLSVKTVALLLMAVFLLQIILSLTARLVAGRLPEAEQSPFFYTATQKTLPAGLYLILTYFSAAAILPMVFYHLAQLTIGRLYWLPPHGARKIP